MPGELTVVAEGVSKRYPGKPGRLFPPVVSIFHRKYFTRSSDEDEDRKAAPAITMGVVGDLDDIDDDDIDDDDIDEDDEQDDRGFEPEPGADEWVWALKDVSLELQAGQALGLLGGPRAGKSTLLRIVGGRAFPTEGRVLVRDHISPPPASYATSITLTGRGTFTPSVILGSLLAGHGARTAKKRREEIYELALLGLTEEDQEKEGLVIQRLALAANAILPANVILIERLPEPDDPFTQAMVERLRKRVRDGASLMVASRTSDVLHDLCDDVIVLDRGTIVDRGGSQDVVVPSTSTGNGHGPAAALAAPAPEVADSHALGALVSAEVKNETAQRPTKRRVRVEHDLLIEVRVETRVPRVEVRCGMDFIAHKNDVPVRLELGKPVKFKRRGTYVLTARADPGTLQPSTVYDIRADVTISHSSEPDPIVLAREAGRISVVGDPDHGEAATETVPHWSGGTAARVESEWSVQ